MTVDLTNSWEITKLGFDPSEYQDNPATPVRINLAALVGDGVLGEKKLADCVEEYNRIHGGQLVCKRGTTILMPFLQMQGLFKKVIEKIVRSCSPHHIPTLSLFHFPNTPQHTHLFEPLLSQLHDGVCPAYK